MSLIDPVKLSYEGADLEAMSDASNYYDWLLSEMLPYVGKNIVEVGSGSGSFSKKLLLAKIPAITFVEPAKNLYKHLTTTVQKNKSKNQQTQIINAFMQDAQKQLAKIAPDTFIYINVFEHIEDDLKEVKTLYKLLPKGGHLIIFVPAINLLMSDFDRGVGHFRRYTKRSLTDLVTKADFKVVKLKYMDMAGILPWIVNFKLLKTKKLKPGAVKTYDSYAVPVIKALETRIEPPIGKNVLLIAEK